MTASWADDGAETLLRVLMSRKGEPAKWTDLAACAQADPEAFFPDKGASNQVAKAVCLSCDVRAQCLEYALGNDIAHGIWGGLSDRQRRAIRTSRKKNAA